MLGVPGPPSRAPMGFDLHIRANFATVGRGVLIDAVKAPSRDEPQIVLDPPWTAGLWNLQSSLSPT